MQGTSELWTSRSFLVLNDFLSVISLYPIAVLHTSWTSHLCRIYQIPLVTSYPYTHRYCCTAIVSRDPLIYSPDPINRDRDTLPTRMH